MNEMYAVTSDGGYVLLDTPTASLIDDGFLVRAEAMMQARMTLTALELRWKQWAASTWMAPVEVFPGTIFTGCITIHVKGQMIGPLLDDAMT